jgi:acyl-CoA-binding protein
MKKYLLLVEDEELWADFKDKIQKDINSEIIELIKEKVGK